VTYNYKSISKEDIPKTQMIDDFLDEIEKTGWIFVCYKDDNYIFRRKDKK
jgi:hypothetical protein